MKKSNVDVQENGNEITIKMQLDNLFDIPNTETIRRVRQEIQNTEKQYLPTDPKVLTARRFKEDVIYNYYANDQWLLTEYTNRKYGVK